MFLDLKPIEGKASVFGWMDKGEIIGIGKIGMSSLTSIDNILYVKGMKNNLLSINQFYKNI